MTTTNAAWGRFQQYYFSDEALGFALDISRMQFPDGFFTGMEPHVKAACAAMAELEAGAIANPDEKRMVGHYWLRNAAKAPTAELKKEISGTIDKIKAFCNKVHNAELRGANDEPFSNFLLIGIGGSALGPQLVADALGTTSDLLRPYFLDNTDPDGIERTLGNLAGQLDRTLAIVISKSGGTPETRNGMLQAEACWKDAGLDFGKHAVAVTSTGSALDKHAKAGGWLETFPMWDWVGGRTSVTSAVGLLPAMLQGIDIDTFLAGAAAMDELTRRSDAARNPALLLALMWHWTGGAKGKKDMVILPYKDRLCLFSKYLQQLVMESLGKELDLTGKSVHQGIAVYGNKGSTDQHAYVQQLREGLNNFFATFIEVLQDEAGSGSTASVEVDPGIYTGDYLEGFLIGTRQALAEKDRESITITIRRLDAQSLGMLIALFERAVGFYATLIGVNAYHQPGVEGGKKAAAAVLDLQRKLKGEMAETTSIARTAEEWAQAIGAADQVETVYKLLERLAANPGRGIRRLAGATPGETKYAHQ
jgi:glucose-6-phosphate isomerase